MHASYISARNAHNPVIYLQVCYFIVDSFLKGPFADFNKPLPEGGGTEKLGSWKRDPVEKAMGRNSW